MRTLIQTNAPAWAGTFVCGLMLSAVALAGDHDVLEQLFGPADISAATGNGGLTVCVNPYGRISGCRWPSPSYHDQLDYQTCNGSDSSRYLTREAPDLGVKPWHGVMWGLRVDGETRWLTGLPWVATQRYVDPTTPSVETVLRWPGSDLTATQTVFVHPKLDLLIAQVTVQGCRETPTVFWYANFAPCTRLIPELPLADWAFDPLNDFAVFADETGTAVYHFRPRQPGAATWAQAERWASEGALGRGAASFGEGVWIGYRGAQSVAELQCGTVGSIDSAFRQATEGRLQGDTAAVGQCSACLALIPEQQGESYRATVYVAFGAKRGAVDATLRYAGATGYADLARETRAFWERRVAPATLPASDDERLLDMCRRCLVTIMLAMDRSTGAIVRCPSTQPPLALDWPRHGFWTTLALDMAGYRALAEQHTRFYCEAVRRKSARGKPRGSLPSACYANHAEGLPHVVLESQAAAWMLAAFWRHALFLDVEARRAYLESIWDTAELAAEFLVSWADSRTGAPLHSFHADRLRDARSIQLLLDTHMGVDSALSIAGALGRTYPPAWRERRSQLEALVKFDCISGQWELGEPIPFGLAEVAATVMPVSKHVEDEWLAALSERRGYRAARALCDIALAWRGKPDKLSQLQPLLIPVLDRALRNGLQTGHEETNTPVFPDALTAALAYIAAMVAYGAVL